MTAVNKAMNPRDFFEKIWAQDFAYSQWETNRYRQIRAEIIKKTAKSFGEESDPDSKVAMAVQNSFEPLKYLDALTFGMEGRRNAAYGAWAQHRANLGTLSRPPADQVEDAEFREVDQIAGSTNSGNAGDDQSA